MINGRVMMLTDEREAGQLWSHVLQQRGIGVVVVSSAAGNFQVNNYGRVTLHREVRIT